MANNNVLDGYKCPKCDSEGPFRMDVTIWGQVLVSDDGLSLDDLSLTETEFSDDGDTTCTACGYRDSTREFEVTA